MDHWYEEKALTAQMAVVEVVTKTMGGVKPKGGTPKLARCSRNLEIFREMPGDIRPGMQ